MMSFKKEVCIPNNTILLTPVAIVPSGRGRVYNAYLKGVVDHCVLYYIGLFVLARKQKFAKNLILNCGKTSSLLGERKVLVRICVFKNFLARGKPPNTVSKTKTISVNELLNTYNPELISGSYKSGIKTSKLVRFRNKFEMTDTSSQVKEEINSKSGHAEFISASYKSGIKTSKLVRFRNKFGMTEKPGKAVNCA